MKFSVSLKQAEDTDYTFLALPLTASDTSELEMGQLRWAVKTLSDLFTCEVIGYQMQSPKAAQALKASLDSVCNFVTFSSTLVTNLMLIGTKMCLLGINSSKIHWLSTCIDTYISLCLRYQC